MQRALHPETDGTCHIYVLHPPGGVAGGDRLEIDVSVRPDGHALLTSPSAQKLYRCPRQPSQQRVRLRASASALEWLPQETLVFDGARSRLTLDVDLDARARFIGWEIVCLGRPASDQPFERGTLEQRLRVRRSGRPVWSECLHLGLQGAGPGERIRRDPWGLRGCSTLATLICSPGPAEILDALRSGVAIRPGEHFAATAPRGALVCRFLGAHAQRAHEVMASAWNLLRPAVIGSEAVAPRIWAT